MADRFQTLLEAIVRDDGGQVEALLDQDASLARTGVTAARYESRIPHWIYAGDTALHVAAAGYRVGIAGLLLAAGADPGSATNHRRSQPLHYASDGCPASASWDAARQVGMIELLVKAGAEVQARDKNGATPLHRAVRTRCAAAVACLLRLGADPSVQNRPGSTPFHLAVQNTGRGGSGAEQAKSAQADIIRRLLGHGISPGLRDAQGKSVLEWAKSGWIRELLIGNPTASKGSSVGGRKPPAETAKKATIKKRRES